MDISHLTRSGQHVGGIVAELVPSQNTPPHGEAPKSGFGVTIHKFTILAVQINLPGPFTKQLQATGIQPGSANGFQTVQIGLDNTGNTMLKPYGTLHITDTHGSLLQNLQITMDTFLPVTAIDYPVSIQRQALRAGVYQTKLTLTYGHQHILHYQTPFTIAVRQLNNVFHATRTPLQLLDEDSFKNILWLIIPGGLLLLVAASFCGLDSAQEKDLTYSYYMRNEIKQSQQTTNKLGNTYQASKKENGSEKTNCIEENG